MKNSLIGFFSSAVLFVFLIMQAACSPRTSDTPVEPTLPLAASPEPTATEQAQPEGQAFTSAKFDYSFSFPAGWIIKDKPGEWADYDPLDPNRTNGIDAFAGYVNNRNLTIGIGARELPDGETLDSWVETADSLIKSGISRGVCYEDTEDDPVSEAAISLDSEPAVMLEYVCPSSHDSFGLVVLSIHKDQGYWITWIAPQGNAEADKAEFTQILSTFEFAE
jgi:hypothetical protein